MPAALVFALQQQPPGPDFSDLFENIARIAFLLFVLVFPILGAILRKLGQAAKRGEERQAAPRAPRQAPEGRPQAEVEGRDMWRELMEGKAPDRPFEDEFEAESVVDELDAAAERRRAEIEREAEAARDRDRRLADAARARDLAQAAAARAAAQARAESASGDRGKWGDLGGGLGGGLAGELASGGGLGREVGGGAGLGPELGGGLGDLAEHDLARDRAYDLSPIDAGALGSGWEPEQQALVSLRGLESRGLAAGSAAAVVAGRIHSRASVHLHRAQRREWRRGVLFAEILGPPVALRTRDDALGAPGLREL